MTYTMGSLFAGIGGFDLGFERAGFKTSWQVEIDPYCQKVLAKNFPEAERFGDIRECGRHNLKPVDVICGGFPCQDISNAGKRAGIEGERSGLWSEMHRIVSELRPKFVLVENVAALLGRGMGVVLGDLAEIGYDAEWNIISASDAGVPHLRERVWVLAHARSSNAWSWTGEFQGKEFAHGQPTQLLSHAGSRGRATDAGNNHRQVADSASEQDWRLQQSGIPPNSGTSRGWWAVEPNVGRVAHGVPKRVDRLRGLGNAVVPQIPEMIARRIKQALDTEKAAA